MHFLYLFQHGVFCIQFGTFMQLSKQSFMCQQNNGNNICLQFTSNIRMMKKIQSLCGMAVGARCFSCKVFQKRLAIFTHNSFSGFIKNGANKKKRSSEWLFCGWEGFVHECGQRSLARIVQADRKATVTEKTSLKPC